MKNKLIIIGAGGHGKVVADIAIKMKAWESIYFLDDNLSNNSVIGIDVIGSSLEWFKYVDDYDLFVAIGNNKTRKEITNNLEREKASIATIIHPTAVIASNVEIEFGTVIMAGSVINSCTKIGKGCIINTCSSVDHDNVIGDFVHISPGVRIAGNVNVGRLSWLGIGSTVINNVEITEKCIIGAGTVVVKNIHESGTYVGIPARSVNNGKNINTGK